MPTLGQELDATIRSLESIRDGMPSPPPELIDKINKLYDQRIDLIDAAIQNATPEYVAATQALQKAAAAAADLSRLSEALSRVGTAITQIAALLAVVA